jgi:hypothetical protein
MAGIVAAAQIAKIRDRFPGAETHLLAAEIPPSDRKEHLQWIQLPARSGPKSALFATAIRLRAKRFQRVIVLAEQNRDEIGYLEAKLWAFVASSRHRELSTGRKLWLSEEVADKWWRLSPRVLTSIGLKAATILKRPPLAATQETVSGLTPAQASERITAFAYLNQMKRRSGLAGGDLVLVGTSEIWSDLATKLGWRVAARVSGLVPEKFDAIVVRNAPLAELSESSRHLTPGGLGLFLLSGVPPSEVVLPEGFRSSQFQPNGLECWFEATQP